MAGFEQTITEKGWTITASDGYCTDTFTVTAKADGQVDRVISWKMFHPPIFGIDVDDFRTLEQRVDELIKSLPEVG